jgi:hypothetical protein
VRSLSLSLSPTLPSPVRRLFLSCLLISYHLCSFQLSALALPEPSAPACLPAYRRRIVVIITSGVPKVIIIIVLLSSS